MSTTQRLTPASEIAKMLDGSSDEESVIYIQENIVNLFSRFGTRELCIREFAPVKSFDLRVVTRPKKSAISIKHVNKFLLVVINGNDVLLSPPESLSIQKIYNYLKDAGYILGDSGSSFTVKLPVVNESIPNVPTFDETSLIWEFIKCSTENSVKSLFNSDAVPRVLYWSMMEAAIFHDKLPIVKLLATKEFFDCAKAHDIIRNVMGQQQSSSNTSIRHLLLESKTTAKKLLTTDIYPSEIINSDFVDGVESFFKRYIVSGPVYSNMLEVAIKFDKFNIVKFLIAKEEYFSIDIARNVVKLIDRDCPGLKNRSMEFMRNYIML